jgi:hypothetical protein
MRNKSTRLLTILSFFCLLAGSAFASGIKHPSDYGVLPVSFTPCGTQTIGPIEADCFAPQNGSHDFLFTISLVTPSALTSIDSATFTVTDVPAEVGLFEGDATDCAQTSVPCTAAGISLANDPALLSPITFDFSGFTGDLSATVYFNYGDVAKAPSFLSCSPNCATSATPEPSEIGILIAAFGCVVAARRKLQFKQRS